ncbi:MAG TPA: TIM barrel protein, partial [Phycisphaerae bacterium]|jgi:sugar phosphate isomerase/epimerase
VVVGIEGVVSHVLNSPARIRRLLDDVKSRNLQVVFDPVNLLSAENYLQQDRVLKESLDLFGDRIAAVHAKDFVMETVRDADDDFAVTTMKQVRAGGGGKGMFKYDALVKWLIERKPGISILLEEASEETVEQCAAYLNSKAQGR